MNNISLIEWLINQNLNEPYIFLHVLNLISRMLEIAFEGISLSEFSG